MVDAPFGPELDVVKYALADQLRADGLRPYVIAAPRSTALAAVAFSFNFYKLFPMLIHGRKSYTFVMGVLVSKLFS